jgi:arylsulfatase regulator
MIVSRYTFLLEIDNCCYVYNTLSNALIEIDKDSFGTLKMAQIHNTNVYEHSINDKELYEQLLFRRFIVENNKDEFLVYKAMISGIRNCKDSMHLTIAPTMDCCFSCEYCFEKKNKSYMSEEIMDSIVKYVNNNSDIKSLYLTWFGGEPLMATDRMLKFYNKFRPTFKGEFSSNIITTAFHIDEKKIETLKNIEVSSIQITIDGNKDNHNKIKFTNNCDDVFSKIINNIDMITELAPDIQVIVRVNITKQNCSDYVELRKMFCNRYKNKKLSITPAIVMDRGEHPDLCTSNLFSKEEFVRFTTDLWNTYNIPTSWMNYPNQLISECAIRNSNSTTVDAEGYVYKCWEVIGNKARAIGRLKDGELQEINQTEMLRNLFGADPLEDKNCSACSYLPLCGGGCPIQRIENEYEDGSNHLCTTYKKHLKELLSSYLSMKRILEYSKKQ